MVDRVGLGSQRAQRPVALTGEEAEVARRRGGDLGGELTGPVEQAHVGVADRLALPVGTGPHDLALDDGLLRDVDPVEREPALGRAAHQLPPLSAEPGSSPRAIGTPTSEPYSVHEPS